MKLNYSHVHIHATLTHKEVTTARQQQVHHQLFYNYRGESNTFISLHQTLKHSKQRDPLRAH